MFSCIWVWRIVSRWKREQRGHSRTSSAWQAGSIQAGLAGSSAKGQTRRCMYTHDSSAAWAVSHLVRPSVIRLNAICQHRHSSDEGAPPLESLYETQFHQVPPTLH